MKQAIFPEATIVRLPSGTLARVREVAIQSGTTSAELMRQAIRRFLTMENGSESPASNQPKHNG